MTCCKPVQNALPPLAVSDIQAMQQHGIQLLSKYPRPRVTSNTDHRVGIAAMPSGALVYASYFGTPKQLSEDWDVVIHIPFGALEGIVFIKNVAAEHKLRIKAVLLLLGAEIAETEFDVRYGPRGSFNNVGFVENLTATSRHPSILDSCLMDCIRRHAPQCIPACINDPTGWACISCAGASIVCCLINCHC